MRTKTLKKNKVNVVTLGCSKNLFDSEVISAQLTANGFEVEHESEADDSEIVIINTCGFIDNAKEESINTILDYANAKDQNLVDKVYVTGCLSERYKDELQEEIGNVDAWFGTRDLPRLLKTLNADYKKELVGERLLSTPSHYAYFKISEGCDRSCSFCAIPLMRGGHVSTPVEELVQQAKGLAAKGVKELMFIAQDLTYYGVDIYKKQELARLIQEVSKVDGIEWIKLHYAFPTGFPMDVLDVMTDDPKLCNYLDMPLQHASDKLLKSMRRGTTMDKTNRLIESIRNKVPNIALRTTLITGYPGESDEDFRILYDWVGDTKFDRLGVFTYSHEEDTHAHQLVDDVPDEVKKERAQAIMDLQQDISYGLNQKKVGQTFKTLFDRVEGDFFIGRTEYDSPDVDNEILVRKTDDVYVRIGDFADVTVDSADHFDLYGSVVSPSGEAPSLVNESDDRSDDPS